jgi:N-acetylneuraminate lyase
MLAKSKHLTGLVAATHTPFNSSGEMNLAVVEKQAEHLIRNGVNTAFIAGSTGESHSLTLDERLALSKRWGEVIKRTPLRLIVHVGSNCLSDARTLAAQAKQVGASAIAALSPSYFKPATLDLLIACCADIAGAAAELPFYFYDIPVLTGVQCSMPDFLAQAGERIPSLAGIKFTNLDLMSYQRCLHVKDGGFDIPWGVDETFLAAMALGAKAAVGSSFNFGAAIYHRMMDAHSKGQLAEAQAEQFKSVQLITLLAKYGYMPAAKALMGILGVEVGPARLPHPNLKLSQVAELQNELEQSGLLAHIHGAK